MMRCVLHPVLMLLSGMVVCSEALAQGAPETGLYLRGQFGMAWPSLSDVNADIRAQESALGQSADWEELSRSGQVSVEFGYAFSPSFSLGLGVGYQNSSRDHSAYVSFSNGTANVQGTVDETVEATLLTVVLVPTFSVASYPGLHLGAQLGMGRGSFDRTNAYDLFANDGTYLLGTAAEEYDQTALAAGLFAGYDIPVSPTFAISMRLGYLMSTFSGMEGTYTASGDTELGPFLDSGPISLTDASGGPMEVSFSGLNLSVGFMFKFPSGP